MHYFLRSLGGVGRVQEGKKPTERATIAHMAAANGGYVGTAASCRGIARQDRMVILLSRAIVDVVHVTQSTIIDCREHHV
jgi:hypothetical protein